MLSCRYCRIPYGHPSQRLTGLTNSQTESSHTQSTPTKFSLSSKWRPNPRKQAKQAKQSQPDKHRQIDTNHSQIPHLPNLNPYSPCPINIKHPNTKSPQALSNPRNHINASQIPHSPVLIIRKSPTLVQRIGENHTITKTFLLKTILLYCLFIKVFRPTGGQVSP